MKKYTNAADDRRQSVRVTGKNLFYFQPVSPEKYEAIARDFEAGIPPYNQEGLEDIQMFIGAQSALARIQERDRDLGEFLAHLDTKLNRLIKMTAGKTLFDQLTLQELNISGSGVSFLSQEQCEVGAILEFHIAFLPNYAYIYCFGKVVSSVPVTGPEQKQYYKVGAEFILIMEEDQEKLIQYNFKQQSLALRNRRLKG